MYLCTKFINSAMMGKVVARLLTLIIVLTMIPGIMSCSSDDAPDLPTPSNNEIVKTVAVVAPIGDSATKTRLERTAQWFQDNFREAQQDDTLQFRIELEWYDELSTDLETLGRALADRTDLMAVIGPFGNESMAVFATTCQKTKKPVIAPTITSEDVIRRYAVSTAGNKETVNKESFFWPLCQSDVDFTETMLMHFVNQAGKENRHLACGFIAPDDKFGQTFSDWAPFHAGNLNVNLTDNLQYHSAEELVSGMTSISDETGGNPSTAFCIVETSKELSEAARVSNPAGTYFVFPSVSEEGFAALDAQSSQALQGISGFSPYADLATGFEQAYRERYAANPTFAECKLYDALLLVGFAARLYEQIHQYTVGSEYDLTPNEWINTIIMLMATDTSDRESRMSQPAWQSTGMHEYMALTGSFIFEPFSGASGYIVFDRETNMQTARTTYLNWQIADGQILHLYYYGPNGKKEIDNDGVFDKESAMEDFAGMAQDQESGISYTALTDQYAVLVQGSNGMNNYRHQADVLSVYQMLRQNGFDDDHILLILDGGLANDPDNNEPGVIRNTLMGHDLLGGTDAKANEEWKTGFGGTSMYNPEYPAAVVDYSNDSLTAQDIASILAGRQSDRLPIVLPQGEGHNVLLYWSGHGRNMFHGGTDELVWRDAAPGSGMTGELLRQTVEQMSYRKILTIMEPCYSEGVIISLYGLTGVLAMSGASGDEQSWAENWNHGLGRYGTWMYDRFTRNVVNFLTEKPTATFRDFYLYCMQNTVGSHVRLVNADYFGNLYRCTPEEFVIKLKSN